MEQADGVEQRLRIAVRLIIVVFCLCIAVSYIQAHEEYPAVTVNGEKWTPSPLIKAYQGDELYKYINGGAEVYLKAGMIKATVVSYQAERHKEPVVAETYCMKDRYGAQKVYLKHFSKGTAIPSLGDEAHYVKQILTVRKGAFYLRIYTYEKLKNEREILLAIARSVLKLGTDSNINNLAE